MATITLPSSTAWSEVDSSKSRRLASERSSPFTGATYQQDWNVEVPVFDFVVPPCAHATGLLWLEAIRQLEIPGNTFIADVSDYVGTGTADKSSMTLRLVRGSVMRVIRPGKIHFISFTATKNL